MMNQPLVTISIPLYKCEDFLKKCLDSVRHQTYPHIEVSLINDQTPDRSVDIAAAYIGKHGLANWEILHLDQNSGLSVVRNKGIDTARGQYLFFLDSDDTLTPDCITSLVEEAERTGAEMTISQIECERQGAKERFFCLGQLKDISSIEGSDNVLRGFAQGKIPSSAVNKLFDVVYLRSEKLYFVPGLFAQDELWTFHLSLKMSKVVFHPVVTYYLHDKSVIHNRNKRNFDNWFTIGQHIDKELRRENNAERRRLMLQYLITFKTQTLAMNWRAQKNAELWKESYCNYQTLSSLSWRDYCSSRFSRSLKKQALLNGLPVSLGFRIFKWRWGK